MDTDRSQPGLKTIRRMKLLSVNLLIIIAVAGQMDSVAAVCKKKEAGLISVNKRRMLSCFMKEIPLKYLNIAH